MASPNDFDWTDREPGHQGADHMEECPICGEEYHVAQGPSCQHTDREWRAMLAQYQQREREDRYVRETIYQNEPMW